MILTTECLICDKKEEDKDKTPSMSGGMDGMGGMGM